MTPDLIELFMQKLQPEVSPVTVYGTISKIRQATMYIAPERDIAWLRDIENDLDLNKIPSRQYDATILQPELLQAGLALCVEAEALATPLDRARAYRNGLGVALLSLNPARSRSIAALTIGKTIRRETAP
ncbi:MAG: site-specific integrase, partial [Beijerinckiaceae bacterium]